MSRKTVRSAPRRAAELTVHLPAADLSDLPVGQPVRAEPGQGPVQLEQLQAVAAQPAAHQEGREARRQEEQRTDASLHLGTKTLEGGDEPPPAPSGRFSLTAWSALIPPTLRGGLENRPRTARISDAVGFWPSCT